MDKGKTINIYLTDGTVAGIRHAELINWTGQAISCPRNHLSSLINWPESARPGVYFLFGFDDETSQPTVYIGETENVYQRLQQHIKKENNFWKETIFFTNKDENLTKAHIKYLESRLVDIAQKAERYLVLNSNTPTCSSLPRSGIAAMEEFIRNLSILLGSLGHRVLEPLTDVKNKPSTSKNTIIPDNTNLFYIHTKNIKNLAIAQRTDEGMVILANSRALIETHASLPNKQKDLRSDLVAKGLLYQEGDYYIFTKDLLLTSPSQSASVVLGYSANGREMWVNANGKSLKIVEVDSMAK